MEFSANFLSGYVGWTTSSTITTSVFEFTYILIVKPIEECCEEGCESVSGLRRKTGTANSNADVAIVDEVVHERRRIENMI